ncbi:hypothetical protein [Sporosarcina sp. JAI121]|uniref:hypothetical protein n=1 Tax=Sporosarcina sp. JAI121 TaxID=2723064 RepID=UPI0015C846C8|nr:hypothetical protein [Sporosarcina sp. JAI121]NYF24351.1 hypothetical protein [Sporosarcina sp. JAI121]
MNNEDPSIKEDIKKIKEKDRRVLFWGFLVLLSYLIYWVNFKEEFLIEKKSPSRENEVIINEYGNGILMGSQTVKIYFKEDGETKKTKKIDIDNDMQSNHASRYNIAWKNDNTALLSMEFENSTRYLEYNFSNNTIEIDIVDESGY